MTGSYDVIIVGGGPAGLSAALLLGRCRRRVLLCDAGQPRNHAARALHGFLSRDGISPVELLHIGRQQLRSYDNIEIRDTHVCQAERVATGFRLCTDDGNWHCARTVLLATGVVDELPAIEGINAFYGRSVHHCPYCDGWEHRDQEIAVYGRQSSGLGLARTLRSWSRQITICTDGPVDWGPKDQDQLTRYGIEVRSEPIVRLIGSHDQLQQIEFANGDFLPCEALFFNTGQQPRIDRAVELGCRLTSKGAVWQRDDGRTSVPGVYVAGDASRDVQLVAVAAAEGVVAAFTIHKKLLDVDLDGELDP